MPLWHEAFFQPEANLQQARAWLNFFVQNSAIFKLYGGAGDIGIGECFFYVRQSQYDHSEPINEQIH